MIVFGVNKTASHRFYTSCTRFPYTTLFRSARIADMAIEGPDDCLSMRSLGFEQVLKRFEHMRVAQIPALRAAIIHDAVIALGRGDQDRKSTRPNSSN